MDADAYKREASRRALDFVQPGMRLGLGSGSTAAQFVALLGERVQAGLDVVGVPTSEVTRTQAEGLGVRLTTLEETPELDLTIDGADEIAPDLTLIKGGGGALLREKIVAAASAQMVVIADDSKWVPVLGKFPLPIEVVSFGLEATKRAVQRVLDGIGSPIPCTLRRRADGHPFVTDGGHFILDVVVGRISDPAALGAKLRSVPGVVEHGLFIGMASSVILAGVQGVRVIGKP